VASLAAFKAVNLFLLTLFEVDKRVGGEEHKIKIEKLLKVNSDEN
jgi:hypothetical protein